MPTDTNQGFELVRKPPAAPELPKGAQEVLAAINGIQSGNVTVHIEGGKIVQVDALEKRRIR